MPTKFPIASIRVGATIHGRRIRKVFGGRVGIDNGKRKQRVSHHTDRVYYADARENYYHCTAESFSRWVRYRLAEDGERGERRR